MTGWAALLGPSFGLDEEPIRERPETFDLAAMQFARSADAYQSLLGSARSALWQTERNDLSGQTADALHALIDGWVQDLGRVPDHLREVQRILSAHADELHGLRRESDREFGLAVRRQLSPESEGPDGAALSLAAYRDLQDSEAHLNRRTGRLLVDLRFSDATQALSLDTRPIEVWDAVAPVFAARGARISLPSRDARPVDCVSVDDEGVPTVHVRGPKGGAFVVGRDIGAANFEVVASFLSGYLPDFRPFKLLHDLPLNDFSAVNWAYGTNYLEGEGPQTQIGGFNGEMTSYREGEPWTGQELRSIDLVAVALAIGPGRTMGDYLMAKVVQSGVDWARTHEEQCGETFRGPRPIERSSGEPNDREDDGEDDAEDAGAGKDVSSPGRGSASD